MHDHEHEHNHTHEHNHEHSHECSCNHANSHCGCCESHEHEHSELGKETIIRYALSALLFSISFACGKFSPIVAVAATLLCGYEIFLSGIKSIFKLKFNECTLILVAAVASICLGEFNECFMIAFLFGIGELTEEHASGKSRKKIEHLIDLTDDTAYNELGEKIDATAIKAGDTILIKPGDKVCVDVKIIKGTSTFDMSNLTGESMPSDMCEGDEVLAGAINLSSSIICTAISDYSNSTAAKIKEYILNSTHKKASTEKFITKFAKVYTPIIIITAVILGLSLPIFGVSIKDAIIRALTFMIASCPCALVISIPLSYFGAIGASSKAGMLIKGSKYINTLASADAIAFDKTGTLTYGRLKVTNVQSYCGEDEKDILKYAASVEKNSSHPIARAISLAHGGSTFETDDVKEIFGKGISAVINGNLISVGNEKTIVTSPVENYKGDEICVYICKDGNLIGKICLDDEIRPEAALTAEKLKELGFNGIYMLSGDAPSPVKRVCEAVGNIEGIPSLLPNEKTDKLAKLKEKHKAVIYVGDGVNDAPSLSASDFGISMGSASGLALEAGDATLLSPSLLALPKVISIARYTKMIVYTNIVFTLLVKLAVLVLAALGKAPIWLALLADVGVMLIAVLRAVSILRKVE